MNTMVPDNEHVGYLKLRNAVRSYGREAWLNHVLGSPLMRELSGENRHRYRSTIVHAQQMERERATG